MIKTVFRDEREERLSLQRYTASVSLWTESLWYQAYAIHHVYKLFCFIHCACLSNFNSYFYDASMYQIFFIICIKYNSWLIDSFIYFYSILSFIFQGAIEEMDQKMCEAAKFLNQLRYEREDSEQRVNELNKELETMMYLELKSPDHQYAEKVFWTSLTSQNLSNLIFFLMFWSYKLHV